MEYCRLSSSKSVGIISRLGSLIAALFLTQLAASESVSIFGVPFKVEGVKPVDAKTVELSLFGQSRLILKQNLNDEIVRAYLASPVRASSLGPDNIERFIINALARNDSANAGAALFAYVQLAPGDSRRISFLEQIAAEPSALELFKDALLNLTSQNISVEGLRPHAGLVAVLLYRVGRVDVEWLKVKALRYAFSLSQALKSYVTERIGERLSRQDIDGAQSDIRLLGELYGEEDPDVRRAKLLASRVEGAESAPIEKLYSLAEASKQDAESGKILYPLVLRRMMTEAQSLLSKGQAEKALALVSHTDHSRHTPDLHELVRKILADLPVSAAPPYRDPMVVAFLKLLSQSDARIKEEYVSFLDRQADFALGSANAEEADEILTLLIPLRPDPNSLNDQIRVRQALQYYGRGLDAVAERTLSRVVTPLSPFAKVKFLVSRIHGKTLPIAFICVTLLAILAGLVVINSRKVRVQETLEPEDNGSSSAFKPGGGFARRGIAISPQMEEYERCLAALGVPAKASLQEIKVAYRNLVKRYHPDAQVNSDSEGHASKEFVRLTNAYEQALRLRSSLGLPS